MTSYFLIAFTDFVPDPEVRYFVGWGYAGIIALNLTVNWVILFFRLVL